MAKLYFYYASMNAGKSTTLLQTAFNYGERGMKVSLWTAALDDRAGFGAISSRIGLASDAHRFDTATDIGARVLEELQARAPARVAEHGLRVAEEGLERLLLVRVLLPRGDLVAVAEVVEQLRHQDRGRGDALDRPALADVLALAGAALPAPGPEGPGPFPAEDPTRGGMMPGPAGPAPGGARVRRNKK